MKYKKLVGEMAIKKISNRAIAELLDIHENSVAYKLSKGSFSIDECIKIKNAYFPELKLEELFTLEKE